jgi:hypothetical protein
LEIERQQIPLIKELSLKYRGKVGKLVVQPLSYRHSISGIEEQYSAMVEQFVGQDGRAENASRQGAKVGRNDPSPMRKRQKVQEVPRKRILIRIVISDMPRPLVDLPQDSPSDSDQLSNGSVRGNVCRRTDNLDMGDCIGRGRC